MRPRALLVLSLGHALAVPAPHGAERPHPVALRRERLNRQRAHAQKGPRR